jgi:hypothetical protein
MSTTINSTHRTIVSLNLSTDKVAAFITTAQGIAKALTNNPSFPNPTPSVATLTAAINDLQNAETAALARTKGAVATRNEKRTALYVLLLQAKATVQAAADANVESGASIIQSAGMGVRKSFVHPPRVFGAKPGPVSGTVTLVAASAARRASYDWEYSTDGGKTWVTAASTLQTKTTVVGLAAGTTVLFRYRSVTKTGEGDWSQPVALLVK